MIAASNVAGSLVSMKARYRTTEPSTLVAELLRNAGSTRRRFEKPMEKSLDGAGGTSPSCKAFLEKYQGGPSGSSRSSEAVFARYLRGNIVSNNRALLAGFGLEDGSDGLNRGGLGRAGGESPGMGILADGAVDTAEGPIIDWRSDHPSSVAEQPPVVDEGLPRVVGFLPKNPHLMVANAGAMTRAMESQNLRGEESHALGAHQQELSIADQFEAFLRRLPDATSSQGDNAEDRMSSLNGSESGEAVGGSEGSASVTSWLAPSWGPMSSDSGISSLSRSENGELDGGALSRLENRISNLKQTLGSKEVSPILRRYTIGEGNIPNVNAGRKVLNGIRKPFKVLWQRIRNVAQRIWHPKAGKSAMGDMRRGQ